MRRFNSLNYCVCQEATHVHFEHVFTWNHVTIEARPVIGMVCNELQAVSIWEVVAWDALILVDGNIEFERSDAQAVQVALNAYRDDCFEVIITLSENAHDLVLKFNCGPTRNLLNDYALIECFLFPPIRDRAISQLVANFAESVNGIIAESVGWFEGIKEVRSELIHIAFCVAQKSLLDGVVLVFVPMLRVFAHQQFWLAVLNYRVYRRISDLRACRREIYIAADDILIIIL